MRPFRFVHAADLHLDSPFVGLRDVNQEVADQLNEATFIAFDHIINLCIECEADFLLLAGDIYDSQDRSLRAQLRFRDGLRRLSSHNISAFVVHGNHDPLDRWSATLELPEQVHVFGGSSVERVPAIRDGQPLAHIYGVSYPTQEVRRNLASEFRRGSGDTFAIGLLHCNVGAETGHEPYAPCSLDDLINVGLDYWALGHVHNRAVVHQSNPTVAYPGNPQGRNPREVGPRGCLVVEVSEDGHVTPEFVPNDVVRWCLESLSIEDIEDEEALVTELETLGERVREQADGRDSVFRVTISGRGPMHSSLVRPNVVQDLEQHVRERLGHQGPFAWLERLDVTTRPAIDVEARRMSGDFVGELLGLIAEYREEPDRLEELHREIEGPFSSAKGRRFLDRPENHALKQWLDAAEVRLLDLLVGDEE